MIKKRLQNVIRALENSLEPDAFTMQYYGSCGTPACAMGHYAHRRDLQEQFRFRNDTGLIVDTTTGETLWASECWNIYAEHFDTSVEEAEDLFGPKGCGGAQHIKEAIAYIENFIARHEVEEAIEEVISEAPVEATCLI